MEGRRKAEEGGKQVLLIWWKNFWVNPPTQIVFNWSSLPGNRDTGMVQEIKQWKEVVRGVS